MIAAGKVEALATGYTLMTRSVRWSDCVHSPKTRPSDLDLSALRRIARPLGAIVMVAIVGAVIGCGSSTPSFKTSAKQAASIEARHAGTLREKIAFEATCSSLDCLVAVNLLKRWGAIADEAAALSKDLKNAKPVESEVTQLTDDTIAAADRISSSYAEFNTCAYSAGTIDPCRSQENAAESAWRAIPSVLDGWKPYGGG